MARLGGGTSTIQALLHVEGLQAACTLGFYGGTGQGYKYVGWQATLLYRFRPVPAWSSGTSGQRFVTPIMYVYAHANYRGTGLFLDVQPTPFPVRNDLG